MSEYDKILQQLDELQGLSTEKQIAIAKEVDKGHELIQGIKQGKLFHSLIIHILSITNVLTVLLHAFISCIVESVLQERVQMNIRLEKEVLVMQESLIESRKSVDNWRTAKHQLDMLSNEFTTRRKQETKLQELLVISMRAKMLRQRVQDQRERELQFFSHEHPLAKQLQVLQTECKDIEALCKASEKSCNDIQNEMKILVNTRNMLQGKVRKLQQAIQHKAENLDRVQLEFARLQRQKTTSSDAASTSHVLEQKRAELQRLSRLNASLLQTQKYLQTTLQKKKIQS